LLEWDEAVELGLGNEEALCNSAGLHFISYPIAAVSASEEKADRLVVRIGVYGTSAAEIQGVP
jgi:hypothetical protein